MSLLHAARVRASFCAFLSIHFTELPGESFIAALRKEEFDNVLEKLERSEEVHPEIAEGALLMRGYLNRVKSLEHGELASRLGKDRTRLYRGVSPRHGPVPPYEALWIAPDKESRVLQEMAEIYAQSGFTLKADVHERLDYLGIQLNYLEGLAMKEAQSREVKNRRAIRGVFAQEMEFLRNHLGKWVPNFVLSALDHAQTDFYRGHLHMLNGFIEQEKGTVPRKKSRRVSPPEVK